MWDKISMAENVPLTSGKNLKVDGRVRQRTVLTVDFLFFLHTEIAAVEKMNGLYEKIANITVSFVNLSS